MAMKVVSVRAMRDIEAAADKSVMSYEQMMRNAGAAASAYLQNRWSITAATKIVFLIGKGNNGGDGLVMALDLAQSTAADISLYLLEARGKADKHIQAARDQNLTIKLASEDSDGQRLSELIFGADIIVDALFGIGLRLPIRKVAADLLCRVKECIGRRQPRTGGALPLKPTADSQRRPRPIRAGNRLPQRHRLRQWAGGHQYTCRRRNDHLHRRKAWLIRLSSCRLCRRSRHIANRYPE